MPRTNFRKLTDAEKMQIKNMGVDSTFKRKMRTYMMLGASFKAAEDKCKQAMSSTTVEAKVSKCGGGPDCQCK